MRDADDSLHKSRRKRVADRRFFTTAISHLTRVRTHTVRGSSFISAYNEVFSEASGDLMILLIGVRELYTTSCVQSVP